MACWALTCMCIKHNYNMQQKRRSAKPWKDIRTCSSRQASGLTPLMPKGLMKSSVACVIQEPWQVQPCLEDRRRPERDCRRHQSWLTARAASLKRARRGQLTSASGASKTSTATAEVPHRLLFKAPSCQIQASERCCLQSLFYHCADALHWEERLSPKVPDTVIVIEHTTCKAGQPDTQHDRCVLINHAQPQILCKVATQNQFVEAGVAFFPRFRSKEAGTGRTQLRLMQQWKHACMRASYAALMAVAARVASRLGFTSGCAALIAARYAARTYAR